MLFNDTYDFGIARRLENLPLLRELGFNAARCLLDFQKASQDFRVDEDVFREVTHRMQSVRNELRRCLMAMN